MTLVDSLADERLPVFLRHQKIGVIPTDTLYGVVAQANSSKSVRRLYSLKKREESGSPRQGDLSGGVDKPGTLIAANIEQMVELGFKRRYLKAVEQFWPSAISIVIPASIGTEYLHLGRQSLAVRIPGDGDLRELLEKTGALLTTSANPPAKKPAGNIKEAQKYFGKDVDFYVDGGDLSDRQPSTVIRIIDDAIEILRQGAVKITEKGEVL